MRRELVRSLSSNGFGREEGAGPVALFSRISTRGGSWSGRSLLEEGEEVAGGSCLPSFPGRSLLKCFALTW